MFCWQLSSACGTTLTLGHRFQGSNATKKNSPSSMLSPKWKRLSQIFSKPWDSQNCYQDLPSQAASATDWRGYDALLLFQVPIHSQMKKYAYLSGMFARRLASRVLGIMYLGRQYLASQGIWLLGMPGDRSSKIIGVLLILFSYNYSSYYVEISFLFPQVFLSWICVFLQPCHHLNACARDCPYDWLENHVKCYLPI